MVPSSPSVSPSVSSSLSPSAGVAVARGDARRGAASDRETTDLDVHPLLGVGVVGAGGVLDGAFDLLRFRFGRLVALTAVLVVPVQLLDLWVALSSGVTRSNIVGTSQQLQLLEASGSAGGWSLLIVGLQSLALFLLGMAVGHLVAGWLAGRDDPFGTVLGAVLRRIWVAPIVVAVALVAKSAAACFGGVGFFLVDALLLVAGPVAGAERTGPFATIGRSVRLGRGAYGTALAVSVGGFAITVVLRLALLLGPTALVVMLGLPGSLVVLLQQASALTLLITLPLTACIAARAHVELRCRLEGDDLVRRARARDLFGSGPGASPSMVLLPMVLLSMVLLSMGMLFAGGAGAQTGPQGPVDPSAVRDQVRDVMSRPGFSYEPSTLQRLLRWVGDQLQKLFGHAGPGAPTGSFGGGIGMLVGWVLILAALAALVYLIARIVVTRTRVHRPEAPDALSDAEVEHRRRATEWLDDAERFEASGEWKEAMRARYRHLVRTLVDRHQLPDVPGRTTGELRVDMGSSTPDAAEDFDTCCLLFELPWYAGLATGADENTRFRDAADRVLAAACGQPFEAMPLLDVGGVGREAVDAAVGADR